MDILPIIKHNLSDNIKQDLRKYITSMNLKESAKLPPETVLAQNFSVSRITVRRALEALEQEGLILRIHGKGTFINPEALQIKISLSPAQEFGHLIRQSGYSSRIELIRTQVTKPTSDIARKLMLTEEDSIILVEKIYYADEHPAILCIDHMAASLFAQPVSDENWRTQSTFAILREQSGKILTRNKVEIQTKTRKEMAAYTKQTSLMECESALLLDDISYDQDNQPIINGVVFYDTDYIRFHLLRGQAQYSDL